MNILRQVVVVAAVLLLSACASHDGANSAASKQGGVLQIPMTGPVVATINGESIPESLLTAVAQGRGLDIAIPAQRKQAMDELQQYVLLAQQAPAVNLAQHADLEATVEAARLQGLANAVLLAYNRSHPVSDEQVAKEYQQQVGRLGNKTYQITLLQFDDEATADKAVAELKSGTAFSKVFDSYRGQAKVAQALPATFLKQMPPEIAAAVEKLEVGHATPAPLKVADGWQLVYLNRINDFTPPALAKVSDRVRVMLQQQEADAYIESLKVNAKIELASPARVASIQPGSQPAPLAKGVARNVVKGAAPAAAASTH